MEVDYRKLVKWADITYDESAARSEEGLPVGNGRMGSLVWTTPSQLKFQINRVGVFVENCKTNSFPIRDSDFGSGYVDIDFLDFGDGVFAGEAFGQQLSFYEGLMRTRMLMSNGEAPFR